MPVVQLSDAERLILANQYEILSHLTKDKTYAHMAQDLKDGHKWLYEQHAVRVSENLSEEDTEHVLSILGIYSDLRDSYQKLTDKSGIEEHLVTFPGFDGNNEAELLHFAAALSRNGNYSQTIGKDARNSHMPTTDMYRRIISEWQSMGKPRYPLSKDQILRLVEARVHSDHRK